MGARVVVNKNKRLTLVIHWQGKRWWEGTTLTDTPRNREQCQALATLVNASIADGTFAARYIDFFPGGNKRELFAPTEATASSSTTFGAFAEAFLERSKPPLKRLAYYKAVKSHLGYLRPPLGHLPLSQLSRARVLALQSFLLSKESTVTKDKLSVKYARNIVDGTLRAILREAREQRLIDHDPCVRLGWPRRTVARVDPLTADERDKVLAHFAANDKNYWPFVTVLAWTGMRPSEATGLRWGDVDLAHAAIDIRGSRVHGRDAGTKTGASARTLRGLAPEAIAALTSIQPFAPTPDDYVFVGTMGKPIRQSNMRERRWYKALRAAKVRTVKLYALRHTFISQALTANCNPKWLSEYTGTSADMINRVYGRFIPSDGGGDQLAMLRRPGSESLRSTSANDAKNNVKGEGE